MLTERQEIFCQEYRIDRNATQAAIRAGYSKKTAYSQGQRLLKNAEIRKKIDEHSKKVCERADVTQERIINELAMIAFSKASDYARIVEKQAIDEAGQIITDANGDPIMYRTVEPTITDDLTEEQKRAIAVIKKGRDGFEIKTYNKTKALELLGKHLGMFEDQNEKKLRQSKTEQEIERLRRQNNGNNDEDDGVTLVYD